MTRSGLRDDAGSLLPLTIFFAVLSLALILVVVAATSLYVERKRLLALADGASLVGAESFSLDELDVTSTGARPRLTSSEVTSAVTSYIGGVDTSHFSKLQVERATSVDGKSATVELSCYWKPPVVTLFMPDGLRIDVTSVARSVFG